MGDSIAGITALRAKTDETTYRAELRRSMNEYLTGSLTYSHSDRDGSSWLKPATAVKPFNSYASTRRISF